jgi:nitrite reductase (NADH) large subunit
LETAAALARHGAQVTLLEGFPWLLPRQLNRAASDLLAISAQRQGINLITAARIKQFDGDEQVRSVVLETGEMLPADLVIVTAGVRTNSYLARLAGLEVREGVVVDNHLRTSDPAVFAAGDLAEHRGVAYGTWAPAQFQGTIAGMNAAGGDASFAGIPRSNILKVLDVDMFSIGQVHPDDASYQSFESRDGPDYRLLVFRDSRLAGAILVGDTAIAPKLKKLIESQANCTELLRGAADSRGICQAVASFIPEITTPVPTVKRSSA